MGYTIGINTNRLGFLNDFSSVREFLVNSLEKLFTKPLVDVDERLLLSVSIETKTEIDYNIAVSVNEFSIAHLESDTILSFDMFIDDRFAGSHRANSVIVATPTGSTAYSLSAGGAILHPSMDAIEIVPVASLRMASRPIVVSGKSVVRIVANSNERQGPIIIRSDGQKVLTWNNSREAIEIVVKCTENKAKMLHSNDWNFFDVLSTKMGWLT
jgi:NAD+ kinase